MKPILKKTAALTGLAGLGAFVPAAVHAAAVDVSGVVSEITAQLAPVAAVGGAILGLMVGIKVYMPLRGMLRQKTGCARNGASPIKETSWAPVFSSSLLYWGRCGLYFPPDSFSCSFFISKNCICLACAILGRPQWC